MTSRIGLYLNKDEIEEIFERASLDGKVISFEDFEYFMKKDEY